MNLNLGNNTLVMVMGTEGKGWASGYLDDIPLIFCAKRLHTAIRVGIISKFLTLKTTWQWYPFIMIMDT